MASEYIKLSSNGKTYYAASRNTVCLGSFAFVSNPLTDIAIGKDCGANAGSSRYTAAIAIGNDAHAEVDNGIAIGYAACAIVARGIAIGYATNAGESSIALGIHSVARSGYSICIGADANANSSIAYGCVVIGRGSCASGYLSVAIGCYTQSSGNYSFAVGPYANVTSANTIQLGSSSSLSALKCRVSLTVGSDKRDKTDITPVSSALNFVNSLKPVTYVFNHRDKYFYYTDGKRTKLSDEDQNVYNKYGMCKYDKKAHEQGTLKDTRQRVGFLAQELQTSLQEYYGTDSYADIVSDNFYDFTDEEKAAVPEGVENQLSVNYVAIIPFLTKAIQELAAENENMKTKLTTLENSVVALSSTKS